MSVVVEKEDWDALIEVMDRAIDRLDGRKIQPVKDSLLEFTSTAAMLGIEDVADAVTKMLDFLVSKVGASWDAEAAATLSFTMAGFREKMAAEPYSPAFSASIAEILLFLDYFEPEEPEPSAGNVPEAVAPAPPPKAPAAPPQKEPQAVSPETASVELPDLAATEPPISEPVPAQPLSALAATEEEIESPPGVSKPEPMNDDAQDLVDLLLREEPVAESPAAGLRTPVHEIEEEAGLISEIPCDAAALYRKMLEIDPASTVFVHLAEELSSRGLWDETVEVCRRGLAYHPSNLRGRVLFGLALRETGEPHEAFAALTEARREIEKNTLLYRVLAEMAEEQGDPARSERLMRVYEVLQEDGGAWAAEPEPRRPAPPVRMTVPPARKIGEPRIEERLIDALTHLMARMEKKAPAGAPTRRVFSEASRGKLKELLSCRTIH